MTGKSGLSKRLSLKRVGNVAPKFVSSQKRLDMRGRTSGVEMSAAIRSSPAELPVPTMTNETLLSRAKQRIDSCEAALRDAAEDIARASEQGATQREVAVAVGKSPAWVNRLLRWRASGYEGSAFGQKSVQGVNRTEAPPPPAITGTVLPAISWNESCDTSTDASRLELMGGGVTDASADPGRANTLAETVQSTIGARQSANFGRDERRDLIEALDLLRSTRPALRAKFALMVDIRRAQFGLSWDQLIIRADKFQASDPSDQETHLMMRNERGPETVFKRHLERGGAVVPTENVAAVVIDHD